MNYSIQDCYSALRGDYNEAKSRLMSDRLISRFVLKFPSDPSMGELRAAISSGDKATAFRAVHTLKGVAANLAFTALAKSASDLTEQMRDCISEPDTALLKKVEDDYDLVIKAISLFAESNAG